MKTILVSGTGIAAVDDEDYEIISRWKWYFNAGGYAVRNVRKSRGKQVMNSMHREILKPRKGEHVDHVNGNRLDCRRANMRICTRRENNRNSKKRSGIMTSRFKGVCWHKNRFRSYITVDKKQIGLGRYIEEIEAARAYNAAASIYFGEFAKLNEV